MLIHAVHTVLQWGYHSVRVLISSLFLYAGGSKLLALPSFAQTISDYGLIPEGLLFPAALFLLTAELIAALALLLNLRGGLTGITLLLLLFIAVLSYGIHLGLDVDCGCFGSGEHQVHNSQSLYQAVYRDPGSDYAGRLPLPVLVPFLCRSSPAQHRNISFSQIQNAETSRSNGKIIYIKHLSGKGELYV